MQQGEIVKLNCGSTFDRYDARTEPHEHFVCEVCGNYSDLPIPENLNLDNLMKNYTGLSIHSHRLEFYGVCVQCSKTMH